VLHLQNGTGQPRTYVKFTSSQPQNQNPSACLLGGTVESGLSTKHIGSSLPSRVTSQCEGSSRSPANAPHLRSGRFKLERLHEIHKIAARYLVHCNHTGHHNNTVLRNSHLLHTRWPFLLVLNSSIIGTWRPCPSVQIRMHHQILGCASRCLMDSYTGDLLVVIE
jgi:hypothetical protein